MGQRSPAISGAEMSAKKRELLKATNLLTRPTCLSTALAERASGLEHRQTVHLTLVSY